MKKTLAVFAILSVLTCSVPVSASDALSNSVYSETSALMATKAEQNPLLYKDLFVTLVYPQVEKAIDAYYDDYMSYLPGEDPWSYEILNIEKSQGFSYSYIVQLQVQPYVGPHIRVGRDRITLRLSLTGAELVKFEHLESYALPPDYSGMLRSKLPDT